MIRHHAEMLSVDASDFSIDASPGASTPLEQLVAFVEGKTGEPAPRSRLFLSRALYERLRDASLAVQQPLSPVGPSVAPLLRPHQLVLRTRDNRAAQRRALKVLKQQAHQPAEPKE